MSESSPPYTPSTQAACTGTAALPAPTVLAPPADAALALMKSVVTVNCGALTSQLTGRVTLSDVPAADGVFQLKSSLSPGTRGNR